MRRMMRWGGEGGGGGGGGGGGVCVCMHTHPCSLCAHAFWTLNV